MSPLARWRRRIAATLAALWLLPPALAQDCPPPPDPQPAALADRGPLWEIERDGRRSWLYGTLHVGKAGWTTPGPRVAAALEASDLVALELDPEDPGVQRQLMAEALRPTPPLPPALARRLADALRAACLDTRALAPLHPAMQAIVLTLAEARRAGLDPAWGQEGALARSARDRGRPLVALERVEQQLAVLLPRDAAAIAGLVERTLAPLESGRGTAALARLARAWEEADVATLADYERWCDCIADDGDRAAMREMVDARNPGLADGVAALHARGARVFAAVGALHMVGEQGLPRLLAERGFAVRPVPAR
ncbi:TraB/GumN family protein [Rubrivivax sp. JA1024]|nr:TraB/GumN family protein [Rubrivivax sp. JA1024]